MMVRVKLFQVINGNQHCMEEMLYYLHKVPDHWEEIREDEYEILKKYVATNESYVLVKEVDLEKESEFQKVMKEARDWDEHVKGQLLVWEKKKEEQALKNVEKEAKKKLDKERKEQLLFKRLEAKWRTPDNG